MNRKLNILVAFLITLMVLGTLAGCFGNTESSGGKAEKDYSNIVENPNISILGYESLALKAGKKKQSVNFYNPNQET